jgi:hypothetical protein
VVRTVSGSCPVLALGVTGVELSGSVYQRVPYFRVREISCVCKRCMVLAQECIQWLALVLAY